MPRVYGLTEQNRRGYPRKPNEDFFGVYQDSKVMIAVAMDGIPIPCQPNQSYPEENGSIASCAATAAIISFLQGKIPTLSGLFNAFRHANLKINAKNVKYGTYVKTAPYWIATVGCALWVDLRRNMAYFCYIGDPLAFRISPDRTILPLTDDQLRHFEDHLYAKHRSEFDDPGTNLRIREHQDRHVRNIPNAHCFCGIVIRGWGALTGESSAMKFLFGDTIIPEPGMRIILASDAMEAIVNGTFNISGVPPDIGAGNAKSRKVEDYVEALISTLGMSPENAAKELLLLTRAGEEAKKSKSDDATFVVVDF